MGVAIFCCIVDPHRITATQSEGWQRKWLITNTMRRYGKIKTAKFSVHSYATPQGFAANLLKSKEGLWGIRRNSRNRGSAHPRPTARPRKYLFRFERVSFSAPRGGRATINRLPMHYLNTDRPVYPPHISQNVHSHTTITPISPHSPHICLSCTPCHTITPTSTPSHGYAITPPHQTYAACIKHAYNASYTPRVSKGSRQGDTPRVSNTRHSAAIHRAGTGKVSGEWLFCQAQKSRKAARGQPHVRVE